MCSLSSLVPLNVVSVCCHAQQELVGRILQQAFPVFEVEEHPHASLDELLQGVGCLDGLTAESALFAHDQNLKRWSRLERVHQPNKSWTFRKLRTADAIVDVDFGGERQSVRGVFGEGATRAAAA